MNDSTGVTRPPRQARPTAARTPAAVIATAALTLLAAACSSGPSSTGTGGGSSAHVSQALAFSRCMRSHGVPNFPDPPPSFNGKFPGSSPQQLGISVSRLRTATIACQNLLPAGQAPITGQDRQDYLKAAVCMRSHGITSFPDPTFSGGSVHFPIPSSISTSSEQFTRARRTCAQLIPAGFPYSGGSGG